MVTQKVTIDVGWKKFGKKDKKKKRCYLEKDNQNERQNQLYNASQEKAYFCLLTI